MNEDKLYDIIERNNIEIINDKLNGLFPTIARINHSCVPNVVWFWDQQTQSQKVMSIMDIKKGDELCVMYCQHGYSRKLRRKFLLQNFGFYCQCQRCNIIESKDIVFYDKLNTIYSQFMLKLDKYIKNKNKDKMMKMIEMCADYFIDTAVVLQYILNHIDDNDISSISFKSLALDCYAALCSNFF